MPGLLIEIIGLLGSGTTVLAYAVKTMLPLRIMALGSSLLFLSYGLLAGLWPIIAMELVLLPLNGWRMWQLLVLRRRVDEARRSHTDDFSVLKVYGEERRFAAGQEVFGGGDLADGLYLVTSGEVRIVEFGLTLGPGEIFGEMAIFTDAERRTATVQAVGPVVARFADERTFLRLQFQDPAFALSVMRTITRRLVDGMDRAPEVYRGLVPPRDRA